MHRQPSRLHHLDVVFEDVVRQPLRVKADQPSENFDPLVLVLALAVVVDRRQIYVAVPDCQLIEPVRLLDVVEEEAVHVHQGDRVADLPRHCVNLRRIQARQHLHHVVLALEVLPLRLRPEHVVDQRLHWPVQFVILHDRLVRTLEFLLLNWRQQAFL